MYGNVGGGGRGGARRQPSPIGADFDPDKAVGQPHLMPLAHSPGCFRPQQQHRIYREELLDNTGLKVALQQLSTSPKEVARSMEMSPHQTPSPNRSWCVAAGVVLMLVCVSLFAYVIVSRVARHNKAQTAMILPPSTHSMVPLWVGSEPEPKCGRAGIKRGGERDCEPDLDSLVNPVYLERWRRGTCQAPESLSGWVCHQVTQDSPNRRLVDDYLLEKRQR